MKAKLLALATVAFLAAFAMAGPLGRRVPSVTVSADPAVIKAGESATVTWQCSNASKAVLAWSTTDGETGTEAVPLAGTKTVTPAKSTLYRVYASRGFRRTYAQAGVEVTSDAPTPEPTPEPTPTPTGNSTLSAIGIGSEFSISTTLAKAARDHELRTYLQSQGGTWAVIDPLMLGVDHPKVLDSWVKVLADSGKKQPAVVWYQKSDGKTKVLAIDECTDVTTGANLLAMAKSHVPAVTDSVVIHGERRALGLKPAKRGAPVDRRVSEILKPLAEADYPKGVDLRGQFAYIKDQGSYGTCVLQAFSGAYEAACFRSFGSVNSTEFSPNFLAVKTDGWNGTWAESAAEVIQSIGAVKMSDQPNYSHKLPANWKAKAAQNKALGVYGPPESNPKGYVAAAIARGLPCCVGIAVGNGFDPDSQGYLTYAQGGGRNVNHEILIVGGWFEHDGKKFVIMKNSWGKSWGNVGDGCCFLEDKFLDDDNDMWVIVVPSAASSYQFDPAPTASQATGKVKESKLLGKSLQAILDAAKVPVSEDAPSPPKAACATGACLTCPSGQCGVSRRRR